MNKKIEEILREWCQNMIKKYEWLTIRFEFNEIQKLYLVSFYPITKIDLSDDFNKDALTFEDKMNEDYGDKAPLFCDEESLFKLSSFAESYPHHNEDFNFTEQFPKVHWFSRREEERKNTSYRYLKLNPTYSLAA